MPRPRRVAEGLETAVVVAGCVAATGVALVAGARLGTMIDNRWGSFPGTGGLGGTLATVIPLLALAGGIVLLRRLGDDSVRRWTPVAPLLLLVALRLVAIVAAPTPIPTDNDPRYLHELAVGVLDGGNPLVSHRPMGYSTTLAVLYGVFGVQPVLAELLNLGCALVAGWSLFVIGRMAWGDRAAAIGLLLYAVVPSQILMVTTIFTETMYAAVLVAAAALAAVATASRRVLLMLGAGVALAASQYVRPLSLAFLPAFALAPLVAGGRWPRAPMLAFALVAAFFVSMTPIVVHNAVTHGALSVATSSYGGWSLFVGANQEHDGRFNRDDQAILRETPGRSVWERSERLGDAAAERITSDPGAYVDLVIRKFRVLWADDTYAVTNAFPQWSATSIRSDVLRLVSQAVYVLVASLAAIGLWRARIAPHPATLIIAGVLLLAVLAHAFVEVQPRYHAYLVPPLCVLAGMALAARAPTGLEPPDQRQVPGSTP